MKLNSNTHELRMNKTKSVIEPIGVYISSSFINFIEMRMMQLQDQGIKSNIYNNYKGQICSILFKIFFYQ